MHAFSRGGAETTPIADKFTTSAPFSSSSKAEEGYDGIVATEKEVDGMREPGKLLVHGRRSSDQMSAKELREGAGAAIVSPRPKPVPAYIIVPLYTALSGGLILFNKHIFTGLNFPYPVFLTAYHMAMAMIGTRMLNLLPFERFKLRPIGMTASLFASTILPLSLLFSGSLIFSNVAYLHLSISFVQMLKAFIPILVLVFQILAGVQTYNHLILSVVMATTFGCIIATLGELQFSMFGFTCQAIAIVFEATRLVLVQIMLRNMKMDPLSSIAMYAPICLALIGGCCLPFFEGVAPFHNIPNVGITILLLNGLHAFTLNVAGILLIQSAGSLVSTLSGICKDIVLIALTFVNGAPITSKQVFGYSIVLSGLFVFFFTGGDPISSNSGKMGGWIADISAMPRAVLAHRSAWHHRLTSLRGKTPLQHHRKVVLVGIGAGIIALSGMIYNIVQGASLIDSWSTAELSWSPTESMWPSLPSTSGDTPTWQAIRQHLADAGDFFTSDQGPFGAPSRNLEGGKFSAAVVYLTGDSSSRMIDTLASMETLARNMPFKRPYPILLIHSGNLGDPIYQQAFLSRWTDRIGELRNASEDHVWKRMAAMRDVIEFVQVDFSPPVEAIRMGLHELNPVRGDLWPGYHSMCRLYATQIFKHPRFRDLDFYMRMDTDSFIPDLVPYDPIDLAFERDLKYLCRFAYVDPNFVVEGMFDFMDNFVRSRPEVGERLLRNGFDIPPPTDERAQASFPLWYNNFEVVHVPSFRRRDVVEWLEHVDDYWEGFYRYRWGDAPLRRATTAMFFEPEDVRVLCSWNYQHVETFTTTCTPEDDMRSR